MHVGTHAHTHKHACTPCAVYSITSSLPLPHHHPLTHIAYNACTLPPKHTPSYATLHLPHPVTRAQQHELLLQHSGAFLQHLLPAYCAAIATPSESGDVRFFCLRMLSDALGACLADPDLYDPSLSNQGAGQQQQQAAREQQQEGGGGGGAGEGAGGGGEGGEGAGHGAATKALDDLLREHVLPLVPALLAQEDPMPLYALKVSGWVGK